MRHLHGKREIGIEKKYALIAALVAIFIVAYGIIGAKNPTHSVEVSFTDDSKSGMQIVPASCASPPAVFTEGSGRGYVVPSGTTNAEIVDPASTTGTMVGVLEYFCVTNTGGPTYFLPAHSKTEIQAFLNAVPRLTGITVQNPGPDNP